MIRLARALRTSGLCALSIACSQDNAAPLSEDRLSDLSLTRNQGAHTTVERSGNGARNVILMLADGYGAAQINATRMYLNGDSVPLSFERLPHHALLTTHNARRRLTDSAASATAMATGRKVLNRVVSVATPGDGSDLLTALDIQRQRGKSTGLVTTQTSLVDATPAAFGAHDLDRGSSKELAIDYFANSRPNVLIGGSSSGLSVDAAESAGYFVPRDSKQLLNIVPGQHERIASWLHSSETSTLAQVTEVSLAILSQNPAGFFLLVEHEGTDTGGHQSDLPAVLSAAVEFESAVQHVLTWAAGHEDTLVIVGADHETGGLVLSEQAPQMGEIPSHSYTADGRHSGVPVPFFAKGPGSERLLTFVDHTDLFPLLAGLSSLQLGGISETPATVRALRRNAPPEGGGEQPLRVDLDGIHDDGNQEAILIRFEDAVSKLPAHARISRAYLELEVTSGGPTGVSLHRVLAPWSPQSLWESFGSEGPTTSSPPESHIPSQSTGIATFEVSEALRHWQGLPVENQGWLLVAEGVDDAGIEVSRDQTPPRLTIHFE